MAEKKQDFVVSDRRRFDTEGEHRPEAPVAEEASPAPGTAAVVPPPTPEVSASPTTEEQEMPAPPTAAEQHEQREAYKASGKKLEEMIGKAGGQRDKLPEMTFERLIESFYMTALLQLGAIRQEGDPPAVDIMGARQTIDSLNILQEKTKGNLTDREQTMLQNVLFELRMAWVEFTNALATAAIKPPAGPVPGKK